MSIHSSCLDGCGGPARLFFCVFQPLCFSSTYLGGNGGPSRLLFWAFGPDCCSFMPLSRHGGLGRLLFCTFWLSTTEACECNSWYSLEIKLFEALSFWRKKWSWKDWVLTAWISLHVGLYYETKQTQTLFNKKPSSTFITVKHKMSIHLDYCVCFYCHCPVACPWLSPTPSADCSEWTGIYTEGFN